MKVISVHVLLLLQFMCWGLPAYSTECTLSKTERTALLNLSSDDFNGFGKSWRNFADSRDPKCNVIAASLCKAYAAKHPDLPLWQIGLLHFHAGQCYALANKYNKAISEFHKSFDTHDDWNAYVRATVDFLRSDKAAMLEERTRIAATPHQMNLRVVDKLIEHFGESYGDAYRSN